MEIGLILEAVKARVSGYVDDDLPVTIGIVDPRRVVLGMSIQHGYPLAMIERNYGIPFGRLRRDALSVISDPDELHACKWGIDVHATVFQVDATAELRLQGDIRHPAIVLSTGLGNVLQNRRSLAYVGGALHHCVGETPDHLPPYACLTGYTPQAPDWERRVGLELLLFSEDGSVESVNKQDYADHPAHAVSAGLSRTNVQGDISWAVSGYPLVIGGKRLSLEGTASNVDDYRHLWSLPKLQKSVVQHLAHISGLPNAERRIEFYFGVEELRARERFVEATHGDVITVPLGLSVSEEWLQTVCSVCQIPAERLSSCRAFDAAHNRLLFHPEEVRSDFQVARYTSRESEAEVQKPGDFYIDSVRQDITVRLLPAVYPHHIVGLTKAGLVVNISIAGLSGRSGITIENAKDLCQDIGLYDALIFDNGNDVVARLGAPGMSIVHKKNHRQTRLTACLHFAQPLDPDAGGTPMEGVDIACSTCAVHS